MASIVKVFNITIPPKDRLCCAICKIDNSGNDPLIYFEFCTNKFKCRLRECKTAGNQFCEINLTNACYSKFSVSVVYMHACTLAFRQFLQQTPQAVAAPITNRKILKAGGSIYVIVAKEFFESCTFLDHCDVLNIQVIDLLDPVPIYIYKACLHYAMVYKLAPQWNKVGLYFLLKDTIFLVRLYLYM